MLLIAAIAALVYWLVVITEGVYLGRRMVVWLYDITAHKYDGIKEFDAEAEHYFVTKPYLAHLPKHPAPRLLDVATGTGRVPITCLRNRRLMARWWGWMRRGGCCLWRLRNWRGITAVSSPSNKSPTNSPFADNTFHGITCLESLEFFPSAEKALHEMVRVLQPGGSLMVTRRIGWEAKTFVGHSHSPESFAALLTNLGLVNVQMTPWQFDYDQVVARKPVDSVQ